MAGTKEQNQLETRIRVAHELGEWDEATTLAITGYGPEILGYLVASLGDHTKASDVFGQFSEDVWRGIAQFSWASSFRTWAYTIARHAAHRLRNNAWQRKQPLLSQDMAQLANKVRDSTIHYLKTSVKDEVNALRAT